MDILFFIVLLVLISFLAWQHGYQMSRKHLAADADLAEKERRLRVSSLKPTVEEAYFFIGGMKYEVKVAGATEDAEPVCNPT